LREKYGAVVAAARGSGGLVRVAVRDEKNSEGGVAPRAVSLPWLTLADQRSCEAAWTDSRAETWSVIEIPLV
jgi:hypothetical protein